MRIELETDTFLWDLQLFLLCLYLFDSWHWLSELIRHHFRMSGGQIVDSFVKMCVCCVRNMKKV